MLFWRDFKAAIKKHLSFIAQKVNINISSSNNSPPLKPNINCSSETLHWRKLGEFALPLTVWTQHLAVMKENCSLSAAVATLPNLESCMLHLMIFQALTNVVTILWEAVYYCAESKSIYWQISAAVCIFYAVELPKSFCKNYISSLAHYVKV